jgi:hypothetical protein
MNWLRPFSTRKILATLSFFLLLNAAFYYFSPPDSFLESDSLEYLQPAHDLIATGSFSSEHRLPLYSFVLAGVLVITDYVGAVVVGLQAVILFATGLVAMRIAQMFAPQVSLLTLILVCFNPSALFYVQQILPDTIFTFFLILHLYFLLKASQYGSIRASVISGVAAGISALIRGNGESVLWLMPFAMSFGYLILRKQLYSVAALKLAGLSILSALLVTSPWLLYNWRNGHGIAFMTNTYKNFAMHENVIIAVALERGLQRSESQQIVYELVRRSEGIDEAQWETFTTAQKRQLVASHTFDILSQRNLPDLTLAVMKAVLKFFFVNDGQTWAAFWQLPVEERLKPDVGLRYSLSAAINDKVPVSVPTYAWHAFTIAFVLLIRMMDVLGVVYLVRKKAWYILSIFGSYVLLFVLVTAFMSYSRYRVPVDPILIIVGVLGLVPAMFWLKQSIASGKRLCFRPQSSAIFR